MLLLEGREARQKSVTVDQTTKPHRGRIESSRLTIERGMEKKERLFHLLDVVPVLNFQFLGNDHETRREQRSHEPARHRRFRCFPADYYN